MIVSIARSLCNSWASCFVHFDALPLGRSSKVVTILDFNRSISDSPILQITIYEIRHFTSITELLTFTLTFHFFTGLFGGTLLYHRSPLSWYYLGEWHSTKKIFGVTAFPCIPPRLHHWLYQLHPPAQKICQPVEHLVLRQMHNLITYLTEVRYDTIR